MNCINDTVFLESPNGEIETDICINYSDEDNEGEDYKVSVKITYGDNEFCGTGCDDYLWMDAFADLQNQLPKDVKLKCCLVCKHGNMCPIGNLRNEVFCTNDVLISEKSDLFFYTEDDIERKKRSRKYTDICNKFGFQNPDYYTYNDWLYCLKNQHTPQVEK